MHGRVILLLAFALWASVATAQTLKYDWERSIPTTALTVSSDGSRIATRSSNADGMMTVILYDGRTGYPIDTVLIDHGPTPSEFRYHIAFVDSTLLTLVVQDSMYFRIVKYNERDASFDTLNADLIYRVQHSEQYRVRQLGLIRFQGEFPRGTVMLNFWENYATPSDGSTENSGGSVFVNIDKDTAWIGPGTTIGRVAYSGDRSRMLVTFHWRSQQGGIGKWASRETHSVRLYESEQGREYGQFNLPRREDRFGSGIVMGGSQTVISGCNRWLGLIQDSLELSWAQIPGFDCEYWHSLAGNSKVVGIRHNLAKKRYELVVSDIITKQLEVVDYWTTSATRWISHASSVARSVLVVIDNNKVRRYTFHPSFTETYHPSIELLLQDTVQLFQTVGFTALPITNVGFRVDSIKSTGGTIKYDYGQHSIVGSFYAEAPGLHDVELWCTTANDSTSLHTRRKVFVPPFKDAVCTFVTDNRLQNILVAGDSLIVSPGPFSYTPNSYVGSIEVLLATNKFGSKNSATSFSTLWLYSDAKRDVIAVKCEESQKGWHQQRWCLDLYEVQKSNKDSLKIGRIRGVNPDVYDGYAISPLAFYLQYGEIPGTDVRVFGVKAKYGHPQHYDEKFARGSAGMFVFDTAYKEFLEGPTSKTWTHSIDVYPGTELIMPCNDGVTPFIGTIDPLTLDVKVIYPYSGSNNRDVIRCSDSIIMSTRGISRLTATGEWITSVTFPINDGVDFVRINRTLTALIRMGPDTLAQIMNHFTGDVIQVIGKTYGAGRTGAYSPEHRLLFVATDKGVVVGYDVNSTVGVADETELVESDILVQYGAGCITVDVGQPIDEVSIYSITGEQVFNGALQDRPLQTSVTAMSWMSGAYVVRVRSGQRWGTSKVAVVR